MKRMGIVLVGALLLGVVAGYMLCTHTRVVPPTSSEFLMKSIGGIAPDAPAFVYSMAERDAERCLQGLDRNAGLSIHLSYSGGYSMTISGGSVTGLLDEVSRHFDERLAHYSAQYPKTAGWSSQVSQATGCVQTASCLFIVGLYTQGTNLIVTVQGRSVTLDQLKETSTKLYSYSPNVTVLVRIEGSIPATWLLNVLRVLEGAQLTNVLITPLEFSGPQDFRLRFFSETNIFRCPEEPKHPLTDLGMSDRSRIGPSHGDGQKTSPVRASAVSTPAAPSP